MRLFIGAVFAAASVVALLSVPASAEITTATGSMIKKDAYGTESAWGRKLVLPRDGTVVRVMYGTYGFSIVTPEGRTVADFLLPEMAVGTQLAAGEYRIEPYVCAKHRHHHVEVTVEY